MFRMLSVGVLAALLSGCGVNFVKGSGHALEDSRTVASWKSLRVESGIHATVVHGAPGVTLTADDNAIPAVQTFLEGSTLVIRLEPATQLDSKLGVKAVVSGDVLEGVDVSGGASVSGEATSVTTLPIAASGGSHVELSGIQADGVSVDASGASTVVLSGKAKTVRASASGASIVDGHALPADTATVDGSGGSQFTLMVRLEVNGSLSGGSRLTSLGGATSSVSTSGGSTVADH